MPTYEYRCPACGVFEVVQRISEEALKQCPTCGQEVKRILSATPFHLKGSGWYKTDYASKSNSTTKSSESSDTPSSSSGEGKPSSEKSAEGSSSKTESGSGADGSKSGSKTPSTSSSTSSAPGNQKT